MLALRVLIGLVFASAAISKTARFRGFAAYLRIPFRSYAPVVAGGTITAEFLVAAGSLIPAWRAAWPWVAVALLAAFTVFYCARLLLTRDPYCACWGESVQADARSLPARALAPSALALRNTALVFACLVTTGPGLSPVAAGLGWRLLAASACQVVVGGSLLISAIRERAAQGAPWIPEYGARWLHTSGCQRLRTD